MVSVRINGSESSIRADGLPTMADLIELIKGSIDPEHMITQILLDGRELAESDWVAGVSQFGTAIIEIETGTPESFVTDRLGQAADVVRACYIDFRDARKRFQVGEMQEGNQILARAVNTLKAFFEWYGTMLDLVKPEERSRYDLTTRAREISETAKKICQQQLYQSWWALGETLEKELEPNLDKLEDFCRKFARTN